MASGPIKVILGLVVVGAAVVIGVEMTKKHKSSATPAAAPLTPPPDSQCLDPQFETPEGIVSSVVGARTQDDKDQATAMWAGRWINSQGWNGGVEAVDENGDRQIVRMYKFTNAVLGGGFWIIMDGPTDGRTIYKGDNITVQGRIKELRALYAGPAPTFTIVLDNVKYLNIVSSK